LASSPYHSHDHHSDPAFAAVAEAVAAALFAGSEAAGGFTDSACAMGTGEVTSVQPYKMGPPR